MLTLFIPAWLKMINDSKKRTIEKRPVPSTRAMVLAILVGVILTFGCLWFAIFIVGWLV